MKVWYNAKTKEYVHENGNTVPASDIRSLPHHRREVLRIAGYDPNLVKPNAPIENESQAELKYVEQFLGDQ